jgi:RNA polymerase sigma-70 factor (ECF subfamily)
MTEYHFEAAIASVHARAIRAEDTDWQAIVSLYDRLLSIHPSPVIELNRAIAIAQLEGAGRGLEAIKKISDRDRLDAYPFYFSAMGELELQLANRHAARKHFLTAIAKARNPMERRFLEQRVLFCEAKSESGN